MRGWRTITTAFSEVCLGLPKVYNLKKLLKEVSSFDGTGSRGMLDIDHWLVTLHITVYQRVWHSWDIDIGSTSLKVLQPTLEVVSNERERRYKMIVGDRKCLQLEFSWGSICNLRLKTKNLTKGPLSWTLSITVVTIHSTRKLRLVDYINIYFWRSNHHLLRVY